MNLLNEAIEVTKVMDAQAAGSSDVNGDVLDMAGFDGVLFVVHFGTITATAVTGIKAQQDAVVGFGDGADLKDTLVSVLDTDSNKVALLDVFRPLEQFIRCVVTRATANAVIASVTAYQYRSKTKATTQGDTVAASEQHVSPIEGTA